LGDKPESRRARSPARLLCILRTAGRTQTLQSARPLWFGTTPRRWASVQIEAGERNRLASRTVVGNILFEGIQFVAQVIHAPLQQITYGKNPQQLAIVVTYSQVAEVPRQHRTQRFAGTGAAGSHFHGRSH